MTVWLMSSLTPLSMWLLRTTVHDCLCCSCRIPRICESGSSCTSLSLLDSRRSSLCDALVVHVLIILFVVFIVVVTDSGTALSLVCLARGVPVGTDAARNRNRKQGRKSAFRARFRPDCHRESTKIGPPAGRRADFDIFPVAVRPKSGPEGRFPARTYY